MAFCGVLDDVDDDSADLILQLLQQDLNDVEVVSKGKGCANEKDHASTATGLLLEDLQYARTFASDRRMTKSMAQAVHADGSFVSLVAQDEDIAQADRAYSERFVQGDERPMAGLEKEQPNFNTLSKLAGRYVSREMGKRLQSMDNNSGRHSDDAMEGVTFDGISRDVNFRLNEADHHRCEACRELKPFFDVITAPCQHEYCDACVREHFEASFTDESLFPPRCCRQPIPLTSVEIFLTKQLKDEFAAKAIEFGTPNRTYCSQANCAKFVPGPEILTGVVRCQACQTTTCTLCKGASHLFTDCPQDTSLQQVLELATQAGWQRCYNCRRLVELELGCNHMTCPCHAEFCYVCGVRWKNCTCPQWDEERLLARAEQVVERDIPQVAVDNPVRIERVQEATQMLRDHHICDHRRWRFIPGAHRCEECRHVLQQYLFECRQCRIRACNRCRRNRL